MNQVDVLFLNNKAMEKAGVSDMRLALKDVQQTYALVTAGDVINPGKIAMNFGKTVEEENILGRINCMPGYLGGEYDMAGVKWIGSGPMNYKRGLPRASVVIILNDPETKLPVAICDGTEVSTKRTGAAGGTAVQYLSVKDAEAMTICGAGAQARTQLEAALIARPSIKTVYVYDIFFDRSQAFAQEAEAKYPQLKAIPISEEKLPNAVSESQILITVTLAVKPFIKAEWIQKGTTIVQMAAHEVEYDCIRKADKVVVDFWETIKHRVGASISLMWKEGLFDEQDIYAEIGQLVTGQKAGREDNDEIIYFNAVGTGALDLAIATRCYRTALKEHFGLILPYWE